MGRCRSVRLRRVVAAVVATVGFALLLSGCRLSSWGPNHSGQLGNGTTTEGSLPGLVGTSADWSQVASGLVHSCSLHTTGRLFCWGYNGDGQWGTAPRSNPERAHAGWHGHQLAIGERRPHPYVCSAHQQDVVVLGRQRTRPVGGRDAGFTHRSDPGRYGWGLGIGKRVGQPHNRR